MKTWFWINLIIGVLNIGWGILMIIASHYIGITNIFAGIFNLFIASLIKD